MRTLAIGDIHGCSNLLDDLLAWVQPTPQDLLITLGDYVDRGPDSRGVLDRLIRLKTELNLICLRGNHEVIMTSARMGGRSAVADWMAVGGVQALGSYGRSPARSGTMDDIPKEHWDFLRTGLAPYYETRTHIFVHAGVDPDLEMGDQENLYLYWEFLPERCVHFSGKQVVCGHTSQKSGVPKQIPNMVCIDTFAHGGGWLTCLDAATGQYWQVDALGQRRECWLDDTSE